MASGGVTESPTKCGSIERSKEMVMECRKRGFEFISQALKCEEEGGEGNAAFVKSLYNLGINQISEGLYNLHSSKLLPGNDLQKLENELLWMLSTAKDRVEALSGQDALEDLEKVPEYNLETKKTRKTPGCPSSRTFVNAPLNPAKSEIKRPIKKPEMFMSELEKFLSRSIINKSELKSASFGDIVGLSKAKKALNEIVVLPALRPELFSGLRTPAKGLLLFGPPGNGKTLLAKALAGEVKNNTLFSITASSLTSKFVGEGEKLCKTLFEMAAKKAPSIIFIDEVDSILCARRDGDHEASRRLKTEFFASFDGLNNNTGQDKRILVIGATNRPFELDDAALRRFTKRIYIPMPDLLSRKLILVKLLSVHKDPLSALEIETIAKATEGYSCSDLTNLARDAALFPLRECQDIKSINEQEIRQISFEDFQSALSKVRTSVTMGMVEKYSRWNVTYGDIS